jgi:hypothetical protein
MNREIAELESELNCLKREKEVLEQNSERRRNQLLIQSRMATSGAQHTELIRQMVELNSQSRQEHMKINAKIYFATNALNAKKRQML